VLWSGSYNTWSDVRTLFEGLEGAMRVNPRIHFISTGGEIPGHDEKTYRELTDRIARSALRDRFHLEGWVPAETVNSYWAESDLGVLTEQPIYEGLLGSKNRIVQWMGFGLPVAYNRMGDLGDLLETRKLGLTFRPGNSAELTERLLWAADHPAELKRMAELSKDYVARELSFEGSTQELVAWAASPRHSPDADYKGRISSPADFATPIQKVTAEVRREIAERLPALQRSTTLRAFWRWLTARG
jgi:glycosyltransferase involved in cell wall biosynthesis